MINYEFIEVHENPMAKHSQILTQRQTSLSTHKSANVI